MLTRKTLIFSLMAHISLVVVGLLWSSLVAQPKKTQLLSAQLHFKKSDKKHLPKKDRAVREAAVTEEKKVDEQKPASPAVVAVAQPKKPPEKKEVEKKEAPSKTKKEEPKTAKKVPAAAPKVDNLKKLAALTKGFLADVSDQKQEALSEDTSETDLTYFDQVYGLIKESFAIPPHLNRVSHLKLSATIRIFLTTNGDVAKIALEAPSGDEHFDNAVLDTAKRVSNYGRVPLMLQDAIKKNGITVEMCPFECVGS